MEVVKKTDTVLRILKIENLDQFLEEFSGKFNQRSPFSILSDLESNIQEEAQPAMFIDYTDENMVFFLLSEKHYIQNGRMEVCTYIYDSSQTEKNVIDHGT